MLKPPRADRWALCSSLDLPASLPVWGTADRAARAFPGMTLRCRDTTLSHISIPEAAPLCWLSQELPGVWIRWESSPGQDKGDGNSISSLMSDKGSPPFCHHWFFFPQHYSSAVFFPTRQFFFLKANASLKTSSAKHGK